MKTKVLVTYMATHTAEVEIEHEPDEDPVALANDGDCEALVHRTLPHVGGHEWSWTWHAEALS